MSSSAADKERRPAIVSGVRTPFARSYKAYADLQAYELGRLALSGLIAQSGIDSELVEHLVMGCVVHDPVTANVAREAGLSAGLPQTLRAHTVSMACISANMAATSLVDMIRSKQIDVGIFGGTDTCSDPPIRLSRNLRKTLVKLQKVRSPMDLLKHLNVLKKLKLGDLRPDVPQVVEFSNGKSMGQGCEILAQRVGVSRADSDAFAARSHRLALEAHEHGFYKDQLVTVFQEKAGVAPMTVDDGPRADATAEKLASLRPAFDREFGVNTAGNSSFLTDGASAVLMMNAARAEELGFEPKAVVKDYLFRAGDPLTEMLSGPALSVPMLLAKHGLNYSDIDVWEIHEAFASQVLANLRLMESDDFHQDRLGIERPKGGIDIEKVNNWGGSLSLGHPFGATGGRLLWTAACRLQSGKRYAVVTGCAAGGNGSALENSQ